MLPSKIFLGIAGDNFLHILQSLWTNDPSFMRNDSAGGVSQVGFSEPLQAAALDEVPLLTKPSTEKRPTIVAPPPVLVGPTSYSSNMNVMLTLFTALGASLLTGIIVFLLVRANTHPTGTTELAKIERLTAQNQGLQQHLQLVNDNAEARIDEYRRLLAVAQNDLKTQRQEFDAQLAKFTAVREQELKDRAVKLQEEESEEGRILAALAPVAENLHSLQTRLSRLEEQRHQQFGTISEQLKSAQQTDQQLQQITQSLESALRNTSVRGSWGEHQLVNIVEASGLIKQVDFFTQVTTKTEDGGLRPDMVIRLPGGKALPVDAKVPFDSFIRANELPVEGTVDQQKIRDGLLSQHVKAVRSHVDALSAKDYGRWLPGSPDFTIAFIPSESLLSAALANDPTLLDYAFRKRVALASPVTLWSVLKTVSFAWQQEALSQEAQEVFVLARELYSRLATLGGHVTTLGGNLGKAVESYNSFIGSLERRVLVSARKFQKLDEDTALAALSALEVTPRLLSDPEMTPRNNPDGAPAASSSLT